MIRRMGAKNLRKNQDFMNDVDECLLNITEVPSLKKKADSIFTGIEDNMAMAQTQQSFAAVQKTRRYLAQK